MVGITISILLHLVLFFILDRAHTNTPAAELTMDVSLELPPPPAPPKLSTTSIVSPSNTSSEKPPVNTARMSERNSEVTHEQVKRGDPGSSGSARGTMKGETSKVEKQSNPHSPPPQPEQKQPSHNRETGTSKGTSGREKSVPHLDNLLLDDSTLSAKFAQQPSEAQENSKPPPTSSAKSASVRDYKAFSRPQGSGAAFTGGGGIRDFLPNLPDGDITLLNAKAATYAGFVRRVAVQVFGQLLSKGWDQLSHAEIRQLTSETTIEAVLSRDGKFIRASILGESGSRLFDSVVDQSVRAGARDSNPPAGAEAKDGLIHFIFKARSWSEYMTAARTGAPVERRWILLATGLEE